MARKPGNRYARRHLICRKVDDGYVITMAGKTKPLSRIVPDQKYPGRMWQIVEETGELSDMVNLTRAIDAAMSRALTVLNKQDMPARPSEAGYSEKNVEPAPDIGPEAKSLHGASLSRGG